MKRTTKRDSIGRRRTVFRRVSGISPISTRPIVGVASRRSSRPQTQAWSNPAPGGDTIAGLLVPAFLIIVAVAVVASAVSAIGAYVPGLIFVGLIFRARQTR